MQVLRRDQVAEWTGHGRSGASVLEPSAAVSTTFFREAVSAPPRTAASFNDRGRTVKLRIDSPADARTSPRTSHCRRTDEAVRVAGKRGQGVKRDGVEDRGEMVDGVGR